ncbi:MAG: hypothetical protein UY23_C0001G0026 [Candidatus Jorgensenbacteria bacterium GW2011_GWA1_48_11]|uniref:Ribose-5-phosphate isomerase n=1 Tax=Candidatus Jorgensenbacteria bacterium GW2011_GWA1_48_11 TaxID=1618660 RepID=A0A0G1XAR7_9BACT|nr:MAG: hypothetical protein UY23_C0001G0026 [Candidatus Jorgensenbacteria bacterium GW2011_GWA1_48_11]KKW11915.1 MAG: hypothetical protein UY51_C0005G0157 [Candidatus Jorgensenbacteria bacterium GW2011_GWB1_49_9]
MVIYIGADHRGFELKEYLKNFLKNKGFEVVDVGNDHLDENDDYPDFAEKVAVKVNQDYENARGVLICGSGVGVDVVANKFMKVRSALVANPDQAFDSRNDDDANVLALAANYLALEDAQKILTVWLSTPFSGDPHHLRRIQKIVQLEFKISKPISEEEQN